MSFSVCPYCGQNPSDRGGATKDHVFVESLGGSVTVRACRECNSTIGHDIEGALQRPNELLNLLRQSRRAGVAVPGTVGADALPVTYDFATHEIRSRQPVAVSREGDVQTFTVRGSPDQVRRALRGMKQFDTEQIEALVAQAARPAVDGALFTTDLVHHVGLARRLAAKCALGAAELAFGDACGHADLASGLRLVLWAQAEPTQLIDAAALERWDGLLSEQTMAAVPSICPDDRTSQVVMMSLRGGRTAVLMHLAGVLLGGAGFVVDGSMPAGDGLPVVVCDRLGSVHVRFLSAEVTAALASGFI